MKKIVLLLVFGSAFVRQIWALTPGDLSRVTFQQHPGQQISRDLVFRDENDREMRLGDFFGKRPLILVLGYYRCPMLCPMINDGLINALENLRASVGPDFQVLDLSIDPAEKATAAAAKKRLYLRRYGRSGSEQGWHCLIGDSVAIRQLTDQTGFRYVYDSQIQQYAHPSGIIVLTPDGKISRYLFGVTYDAKELLEALTTAKQERSSSVLSQLILLCYHYNPITGKYGELILSTLRIASIGFVALIGWWVLSMTRSERKQSASTQ